MSAESGPHVDAMSIFVFGTPARPSPRPMKSSPSKETVMTEDHLPAYPVGGKHCWRRARPEEKPNLTDGPGLDLSGTVTGRTSSSGPNLSGVPRGFGPWTSGLPKGNLTAVMGRRSGKSLLGLPLPISMTIPDGARSVPPPLWKCGRCGCVLPWENGPPPPHPMVGVALSSFRFSVALTDVRDGRVPECDMFATFEVMES